MFAALHEFARGRWLTKHGRLRAGQLARVLRHPSSLNSGEQLQHSGLDISPPDGDEVIKQVQARGLRPGNDSADTAGELFEQETRKINTGTPGVPIHPSMAPRGLSSGSPGGKVPGSYDDDLSAQGLNPGLNAYQSGVKAPDIGGPAPKGSGEQPNPQRSTWPPSRR